TTVFSPNDRVTIQVHYHCDGPPPAETLGLAFSLNCKGDLLAASQAYTQNLRPGETQASYLNAPYRRHAGQKGIIEATLNPLQLRPGEYLLSVGLVPNIPCSWEFYEYHHFAYDLTVASNGDDFGAMVYAKVKWAHRIFPAEDPAAARSVQTKADAAIATSPIPSQNHGGHRTLLEE